VPSQQQQFPTQRNRRACVGLTANALTVSLVPWQSGRALVWDVTVVCPLADSYVASAAREARSVTELAATKKEDKYSGLAAELIIFFNQLRSRFWVQLMNQLLIFSHF